MSVALLQQLDAMRLRVMNSSRTTRRIRVTDETYTGQLLLMPVARSEYDIWIHPADWERVRAYLEEIKPVPGPPPCSKTLVLLGIPIYEDADHAA